MSDKISHALARLNSILPLARHQLSLKPEALQIHQVILHSYALTGIAPLASELTMPDKPVAETLAHLQQLDLILLDSNAEICGAYPFTSETRIHRVDIDSHKARCMCALDALAISHMFNCVTQIHSQCALTAVPVIVQQNGYIVLNNQQCTEIFLAINWAAASDTISCANSLCIQMNFISGTEHAHDWLLQSDQHELFTLTEAIDLAAQFFMPLVSQRKAA